jgi:hypothetical protein
MEDVNLIMNTLQTPAPTWNCSVHPAAILQGNANTDTRGNGLPEISRFYSHQKQRFTPLKKNRHCLIPRKPVLALPSGGKFLESFASSKLQHRKPETPVTDFMEHSSISVEPACCTKLGKFEQGMNLKHSVAERQCNALN